MPEHEGVKGSAISLESMGAGAALGTSRTKLVKDPRQNPFHQRQLEHPTTNNDTLIHLAKGSLGTGLLAMPYAFKNAGLALGTMGTIIVGIICTYCVHILIVSAHELCWRHNLPTLDFGALAELAIKDGPKQTRKLAGFGRGLVKTFFMLVSMGACCVYIVFVSENISLVLNQYLGREVDITIYILCVTAVVGCLSMVRNLRYLAPLSMLSNVLVMASIVIIFIYVFHELPGVEQRPAFMPIARLPVFFSTVVFALEGMPVVMPLENNMKTPQHFTGCFRVLNTAMALIVSLYTLVGFFGFLKYGEDVEGSISLNLPSDEGLAQAAQLMLGVAIAFTYPLQFYCAMDFTWPSLRGLLERRVPALAGILGEYLYRVFLVLLSMGIALGIPNLSALMGLIGAVCLATVGIMFPAVLETAVFWHHLGPGRWKLWKNLAILLFGLTGFATGLYTSIKDIIASFSE